MAGRTAFENFTQSQHTVLPDFCFYIQQGKRKAWCIPLPKNLTFDL
jgi:hypothetical protein